jgi:hypothetical protein
MSNALHGNNLRKTQKGHGAEVFDMINKIWS